MSERIITGLLLVVAVIHLLPISGFFGSERLSALYGVDITNSNLQILMRHRAVLFGILGTLFAYAAFNPNLQVIAFIAAFVSLTSFFFLSFSVGEFNEAIRKVVIADVVASICLGLAVIVYVSKGDG
jgi:hypothetical protein